MKNAKYSTSDVKNRCENKLGIQFRSGKELNGWYVLDGRRAARITVPYGRKPIPPKTYKSMARQLGLDVDQFDRLLECPLREPEYGNILRAQQ
jgi:hypothetical protein